jgi:glycosyltransferase involved in cell wall biosynthesis
MTRADLIVSNLWNRTRRNAIAHSDVCLEFCMSNRVSVPAALASHPSGPVVRADLHCHSEASNLTSEAMLKAIDCPESFSTPADVYAQARRRGMDFVTITDHDSIGGVARLTDQPGVLFGEELTCYFPEDHCKIHLLIWGLTEADHSALQALAENIYEVAEEVERRNLAHAVAHPVYRQNDRLERWNLERLVLMFKGFETLNGSHSVLHRQSLEPLLDSLTPAAMCELSATHRIPARWRDSHIKTRTGGSDDHGLFNIGRTWTEFPTEVTTVDQLLECLRTARTRPGGEAGSSLKLAHNFYGVGIRYYQQKFQRKRRSGTTGLILKSLVGGSRAIRRRDVVRAVVKSKAKSFGNRLILSFRRKPQPTGAALLLDLFMRSARQRLRDDRPLLDAIKSGQAVLGEHEAMFNLISSVNRDVATGIAKSVMDGIANGNMTAVFDAVSAVTAHQFLLLPYYFALFHQNQERRVLPRITGYGGTVTRQAMKLGVFTDTFDEINGVGGFIQDMNREAAAAGRSMLVATCATIETIEDPLRKNFAPLLSQPLPYYPDQPLTIPPLAEIMEWADRQQFDVIQVHTPGPMGLCGWLIAKMLRVPLVGTYHTDFPQYVNRLTGDHRLTTGTAAYMRWFYGQTVVTLSRSVEYCEKLRHMGLAHDRVKMTLAGVDTKKFNPSLRDSRIWESLGVKQPYVLLLVGRVSLEKNLSFLTDAFKQLCQLRSDVALVIVGDGPYRQPMENATAGLPVHFLGARGDDTRPTLSTIYASADLFVFPSETDTLGQVVIEAQASGLPVLVSDHGGPKEAIDDGITGQVVPTNDPATWTRAIDQLLDDTPRRLRMGRTGTQRMSRFSQARMFEAFWDEHFKAVEACTLAAVSEAPATSSPSVF